MSVQLCILSFELLGLPKFLLLLVFTSLFAVNRNHRRDVVAARRRKRATLDEDVHTGDEHALLRRAVLVCEGWLWHHMRRCYVAAARLWTLLHCVYYALADW